MHWLNFSVLLAMHLAAVGGLLAYCTWHGVTLTAVSIGVVGAALTTFGVSLGYHRLFAHRAYETGPVVQFVLLALGASALQNSALNWSADHRRHHRYIDTPRDPYNAKRGLWYSHMGWVLERTRAAPEDFPVPDLSGSPLVRWQHRNYVAIGAVTGFLLPALVGWLLGDLWGGLLFGGVLRLVACYHATFSINSLAHWVGKQPYSTANTSRDSWLAALVTMGEGYHNYHHTFPSDYRNGVRAHQFDPSKWVLFLFERVGLAWDLKRTPDRAIARARVRADHARLERFRLSPRLFASLERSRTSLEAILSQWATISRERRDASFGSRAHRSLSAEANGAHQRFRAGYRQWQRLLRRAELEAQPAGSAG